MYRSAHAFLLTTAILPGFGSTLLTPGSPLATYRLENLGDTLRDNVLAELFETAKDPILVIKLKEIYQDSETVLDICEDVAHVVGSILVKQA